jgi:NAD(P)-dependent dehydrogenase (short-subunit alcohol dehydrogenase family)
MERMLASTPINRLGELEDVANMAMVLSTDLTSYVTGAIIPVDGGRTIAGGSDYGSDIRRRNA